LFPGIFHYPHTAASPLNCVPDFQQTSIPIFLPLMIPKPERFDSLLRQKFFPCFIPLNSFRQTMLKPVEFDIQFRVRAVKIQNMSANRVLPSKFEAGELSPPQCTPEFFFFVGLIAPKLAGDLLEAHAGRMQIVSRQFKFLTASIPSPRPAGRGSGRGVLNIIITNSSPRPSPRLARRGS
jgi:hypothetical protein